MFDPSEFVGNFWFGYITRHCRSDYMRGSPLAERMNPLRYEIGIGRHRPCRFVWNRDAWMQRRFANLIWRFRSILRTHRGGEK
jgi:hypothetical protein